MAFERTQQFIQNNPLIALGGCGGLAAALAVTAGIGITYSIMKEDKPAETTEQTAETTEQPAETTEQPAEQRPEADIAPVTTGLTGLRIPEAPDSAHDRPQPNHYDVNPSLYQRTFGHRDRTGNIGGTFHLGMDLSNKPKDSNGNVRLSRDEYNTCQEAARLYVRILTDYNRNRQRQGLAPLHRGLEQDILNEMDVVIDPSTRASISDGIITVDDLKRQQAFYIQGELPEEISGFNREGRVSREQFWEAERTRRHGQDYSGRRSSYSQPKSLRPHRRGKSRR